MNWGSFVLGLLAGGMVFGSMGVFIGGLVQMAARGDKPSELSTILREAGMGLGKGEVVSFTIGHDVCISQEEQEESDRYWEQN
jgi:hypothetical protein